MRIGGPTKAGSVDLKHFLVNLLNLFPGMPTFQGNFSLLGNEETSERNIITIALSGSSNILQAME